MIWRKVLDGLICLERKPTQFEGHSHARNDLLQICCMLPDGILILGGRISSSVLPTIPMSQFGFMGRTVTHCTAAVWKHQRHPRDSVIVGCIACQWRYWYPNGHNSFWDWQPQWNTVYIQMRYRYTWYTIHQLALHLSTSMMSRLDKFDKHTSFMLYTSYIRDIRGHLITELQTPLTPPKVLKLSNNQQKSLSASVRWWVVKTLSSVTGYSAKQNSENLSQKKNEGTPPMWKWET